ncbi:amidohydrolase [Flaviflexus massiliensis]|uniref:amidohydrolase n=1 Tax=Flaviflexus massiliensis TaxID=1522309 RepID=UPI000A94C646|nr:amidohydrolase [Flaviflexus massiliensis]
MHACGHDVHIVSLLGAREALAAKREEWSGTFVGVFQPGEEACEGARAMVAAGLVDVMPKPDVFLGQQVMPVIPLGQVATWPGVMMSSAVSIKITIHGVGGHGSQPENCIDPIVLASPIVLRLQTIVSREVAPSESAVVTVGSIRAGAKSNIIPDTATLLVNARAFDSDVEKMLHAAIERIVRAECMASVLRKNPSLSTMIGSR